jgi:hypothetical protein
MSCDLLAAGTALLGSYSHTPSGLLPTNVTGSQNTSARGKRARSGPAPGSESDEDQAPFDASGLPAIIRAAVQAMLPEFVSQLKPLLAAELTSDIQRAMAF